MKKLMVAAVAVLAAMFVSAQDAELVKVRGKGTGADRTEALKDAYRDAVERAVGLYVDAEQMMKNEELVKDQILTQSNAYIDKYDVVKETTKPNGLVEVQILDIVDDFFQTAANRIAVAGGILAVEHIEDYTGVHIIFVIALHHGDLVEIGQQGKILCCDAHLDSPVISCLSGAGFACASCSDETVEIITHFPQVSKVSSLDNLHFRSYIRKSQKR